MMANMKQMIALARKNGLWLNCPYQDLWFSPDELEKNQADGKFCWGPDNWRLRDPSEQIVYLSNSVIGAQRLLDSFKVRVAKSKDPE